jgi:hypothetical protein
MRSTPPPAVVHLIHLRRKQRTSLPCEEYATACGSAPLHLRRNQQRTSLWHGGLGPRVMLRGRRPPCAEKANYRVRGTPPPAMVCLFTSAKTDSQSLARGPGPMSHPPWAPVPGCREAKPPLAPVPRLLEATAEDRKIFKTNAAVSRRPARDPAKASRAEVTGQSTAGTGMADGVTEGGLEVITPASARKQHTNRQSGFGPTCRLVSSPEAGPRATVSTLEMGYPLLQYEGAVSMRLSLVAWRTTHDLTMRTAPGPPRGREDNIFQGINGGSGPPRESVGPLHIRTGPPGRVQDLRGYRPDPRDRSRTSAGTDRTSGRVPDLSM